MGELVKRDDQEGLERVWRNVIAPAAGETIAELHVAAHRTTRHVAEILVAETDQITDERILLLMAPHVEATVEQVGNITLDLAEAASDQITYQVRNAQPDG